MQPDPETSSDSNTDDDIEDDGEDPLAGTREHLFSSSFIMIVTFLFLASFYCIF